MRRHVFAALMAALFAIGAVPASAATHADPTGDNCKVYQLGTPSKFCGFDIGTAADSTAADGTVHLTLDYKQQDCLGNIGSVGVFAASFEIYDDAATAPAPFGPHNKAIISRSGAGYTIRMLPSNTSTPVTSTATGTTAVHFDVAIPPAIASQLGHFKWLASNSCIGESPSEGSDIAPNTGLYDHSAAGSGGAVLTKGAVSSALAATLAKTKITKASALIAKGFPVTFAAPGPGTLKVTLGRIKLIRVHGVARAQATVLARLTVTVTKAGTVRKTVKLTAAGKKLLRNARRTNKLKLTVAFKSGAISVSKSKAVSVKPRPR